MPSCVAFGCRNRSTKGFKLFVFPRDKQRRKLWENKVKLKNWSATNNSYLCECHFEDDQFEQHRADGKRKLKPNAVPTIFGDKRPKPKRKPPKVRRPPTPPPDHPSRRHEIDHQYSKPNSQMPDDLLLDLPPEFQIPEEDERPVTSEIERNQTTFSMVVLENSVPVPGTALAPVMLPVAVSSQSLSHNICVNSGHVNNNTLSSTLPTSIASLPNGTSVVRMTNSAKGKSERELQFMNKITILENKLQNARRQMAALYRDKLNNIKRVQQLSDSIKMFLNEDQIQALSHKGPRGLKWSSPTIMKAFQLRFACGSAGYKLLIDQKQPLPSLRTLRRRMKDMKFDSGILYEVFTLLKVKAHAMKADDKLCILNMGEMNLTAGISEPDDTGNSTGYVTLPNHFGIATHGVVLMLAGVRKCWRQIVAYFFTGEDAEGSVLRRVVEEIIELASKCGLHVMAITSDLGSASQIVWQCLGIGLNESSTLVNKIKHPCDDAKDLYFIPDPLYLLRYLKDALTSRSVNLPDDVVQKHNLPSSLVSAKLVNQLDSVGKKSDTENPPIATVKGQKIKNMARNNLGSRFFSLSDVDELQYISTQNGQADSFQVLAWFIKTCHKWYNLVTRRYPAAFSYNVNKDKYNISLNFLQSFIDIFSGLQHDEDAYWKLIQIGFLLATKSILDIEEESFKGTVNYLSASRFAQDCLDTLFNSLTADSLLPTSLQFKNSLRAISVVQYLGASHK